MLIPLEHLKTVISVKPRSYASTPGKDKIKMKAREVKRVFNTLYMETVHK
jgi:hypothetical protein